MIKKHQRLWTFLTKKKDYGLSGEWKGEKLNMKMKLRGVGLKVICTRIRKIFYFIFMRGSVRTIEITIDHNIKYLLSFSKNIGRDVERIQVIFYFNALNIIIILILF